MTPNVHVFNLELKNRRGETLTFNNTFVFGNQPWLCPMDCFCGDVSIKVIPISLMQLIKAAMPKTMLWRNYLDNAAVLHQIGKFYWDASGQ